MKNVAAIFVFVFFLFSCEPPETEEVQIVHPDTTEVADPVENADTSNSVEEKKENSSGENEHLAKNNKPLLTARGSEPGWYAEFFADHLRLLIDNGTDSLMIDSVDFSNINADKNYFELDITGNNKSRYKNLGLSISITGKPCTEEGSGEKREKSISIKYKNKTYKGCASNE